MRTVSLPFFLSVFLSAFLSLPHTHTHSLTSPGIRSFYRAAMCWRGRWYGRAVSPSSDWISDQYPVPRRRASLGRTDCLWKPVLVVSRLSWKTKGVWCIAYCLRLFKKSTVIRTLMFSLHWSAVLYMHDSNCVKLTCKHTSHEDKRWIKSTDCVLLQLVPVGFCLVLPFVVTSVDVMHHLVCSSVDW